MRQTTSGKRFMHRLRRCSRNEQLMGLLMLGCGLIGLAAANIPVLANGYRDLSSFIVPVPLPRLGMPLSRWAEDGLLTLFFLVVGLDLRQEMATGFLSNPRKAAVPVIAACGGVAAPAAIFWVINHATPVLAHGWTVPTATDIAFSLTMLTLVPRHVAGGLRVFLMTLAVVDDVIGILLIAIVYSHITSPWPMIALVGMVAWYAMMTAGIHPTLSGVAVGLLTPARPMFGEMRSRAERYHDRLSPWSSAFALPVFAFFAMGIPLTGINLHTLGSTVFLGIFLGLVVGKPLGIMLTARLCTLVGLSLGDGVGFRDLLGVAQLCGIGFTVSFLMADLAFPNSAYTDVAKFAVLVGSFVSCLLGALIITIWHRPASPAPRRCSEPVR